jgi:hypothetical protein
MTVGVVAVVVGGVDAGGVAGLAGGVGVEEVEEAVAGGVPVAEADAREEPPALLAEATEMTAASWAASCAAASPGTQMDVPRTLIPQLHSALYAG